VLAAVLLQTQLYSLQRSSDLLAGFQGGSGEGEQREIAKRGKEEGNEWREM